MSTESAPTVGAIEIRLFGELSIIREGRSMTLPASKKTRALFAYLVTSQRTHTREKLCDFLWEGPEDPRAALRWSLAKIRPLIDEPGVTRLVADRERVGFEPRGARTDLLELRALLAAGLSAKPTHELEAADRPEDEPGDEDQQRKEEGRAMIRCSCGRHAQKFDSGRRDLLSESTAGLVELQPLANLRSEVLAPG